MKYLPHSFTIVLILCLMVIGIQNHQIAHLGSEVEIYRDQIALLQKNNNEFAMQVDAQNTTIATLKAKADAEHKTAQDAIAGANILSLKISQMSK